MEGSDGMVALLPMDPDGVGGDLVLSDELKPSGGGCVVYLDGDGDAAGMMSRALAAGAEALMPVTYMGEVVGSIASSRTARATASACTRRRREVRAGAARRRLAAPPSPHARVVLLLLALSGLGCGFIYPSAGV